MPSTSQQSVEAPPVRSRIAAGGALAAGGLGLLALVLFAILDLPYVFAALLAATLATSALWVAATNRRFRWAAAGATVVLSVAAVVALVATGRSAAWFAVGLGGLAVAALLGRLALRWEVRRKLEERWHRVAGTRRGVVLINPRSGDGKAARLHLADEARRRGIEPVLLEPGDDLRVLVEGAVSRGADALGMAGGDGSQAAVAAVAAAHGLPFVCVPAGTRNHFALDLGLERDDPVRALDAFGPAQESTIDLAEVNGEPFVNNVSLGVYSGFVASDEYREAKRRTVAKMLPESRGTGSASLRSRHRRWRGAGHRCAAHPRLQQPLHVVEPGRVRLPRATWTRAASGSRPSRSAVPPTSIAWWRSRPLVIPSVSKVGASGLPRPRRLPGPPASPAALDGEARTWDPPLRFTIRPKALRVRIPLHEPGASPAFLRIPFARSTVVGLARVVAGRPSSAVPMSAGTS